MDNKILEKLIKNYDDNILYCENCVQKKQDSCIICGNLRKTAMYIAEMLT